MQNKGIFISFMLIFFILTINRAQETEITKIREMYSSYNKMIGEQGEDTHPGLPQKIEMFSRVTERATGPVSERITMYYDRHEQFENDNFTYRNILRKVVIISEASWKTYVEFFFSPDEQFVFYYQKHTGYIEPCSERRLYFKNDKLIKVIYNINPDAVQAGECAEGTRDSAKLSMQDTNDAAVFSQNAAYYLRLFQLYSERK